MFLVWSLKRRAVTSVTLATSYSLGRAVALAGMLVAFRIGGAVWLDF